MVNLVVKSLPENQLRYRNPKTSKIKRAAVTPLPADHIILTEPIAYVDHPAFRRKSKESMLRDLDRFLSQAVSSPECEAGLTFVAGFVSQPLLTPDQEQLLFAGMNYYRYRAETQRRRALKTSQPRRSLAGIARDLRTATEIRNRIVSSNLRLVVSLAKKLATSLDQMSELISEGILPLIRAVELFDVSLGNRFSTYATWAVRNQMLRMLKRSRTLAMRFTESIDELPIPLSARAEQQEVSANSGDCSRRVRQLLETLPERERQVVQARFGLDGEPQGQSLADVASKVGLSKERVRQLVLKSLERLRSQLPDGEPFPYSVC